MVVTTSVMSGHLRNHLEMEYVHGSILPSEVDAILKGVESGAMAGGGAGGAAGGHSSAPVGSSSSSSSSAKLHHLHIHLGARDPIEVISLYLHFSKPAAVIQGAFRRWSRLNALRNVRSIMAAVRIQVRTNPSSLCLP